MDSNSIILLATGLILAMSLMTNVDYLRNPITTLYDIKTRMLKRYRKSRDLYFMEAYREEVLFRKLLHFFWIVVKLLLIILIFYALM